MKVYVRLLSTYSKYLPANARGFTCSIDVPVGIRIEELRDQLPVPADEGQVVLVNGQTPLPEQVLEEGDTVAMFPAIAGG